MTDPLAIAEGLLSQPTAPRFEDAAMAWCEQFAADRPSLWSRRDDAGNLLVGTGDPHADTPLVLVAHLDHPAFHIEADRLSFQGGVPAGHATPGTSLATFAPDGEPVGRAVLTTVEEDNGRLTGATAEGALPEGGFATWDFPGWSVEGERIVSVACDDLLGAAAVLAALERVDTPVWGLLTRAEEIGLVGAEDAILVGTVPINAPVISLECSKALVSAPQGDGVIVRVGDRTSVFDPSLSEALRQAATRAGVRFQRKLMDGGTCEATAFCAAGYRASGLAVALGNYHNAADEGFGIAPEHVVVDDWLAEVELLVALGRERELLHA